MHIVAFEHYKQSLMPEIELFLQFMHNRVVVLPQTEGAIKIQYFD